MAVVPRVSEWRKLPLSLTELCIDTTLRCGQSFRWRKVGDEWSCTLNGRIVSLKQDPSCLHYRVIWPEKTSSKAAADSETRVDDTEALLRHYLSLKVDLKALYEQWSKADPNFKKHSVTFSGVRILNQDAWETLVSFICSSNNNISRISQMVHKLCLTYGPFIGKIGDEPYHDFPSPDSLTGDDVESQLRALGFGYRAKYIASTAKIIAGKPKGWLNGWRNPENPAFPPYSASSPTDASPVTYKDAHKELLQLTGVGPKVADCVCLMGLGWAEAVPIDTHVWQIAQRDYKYGKGKKTFTMSMYHSVGDFFRELWGKEAGWAHSVLFTADLRTFSDRITKEETVVEIPETKKEVKLTKMMIKVEEEGQEVVLKKRRRVSSVEGAQAAVKVPKIEPLEESTHIGKRRSTRIRTKPRRS